MNIVMTVDIVVKSPRPGVTGTAEGTAALCSLPGSQALGLRTGSRGGDGSLPHSEVTAGGLMNNGPPLLFASLLSARYRLRGLVLL